MSISTIKSVDLLIFFYSYHYVLYQLFLYLSSRIKLPKIRRTYAGGISILIPSYDEVLTINDCIDSIINSEVDFKIEIIVIDDGRGSDTFNCLKRRCVFTVDEEKRKLNRNNCIRNIYKTKYKGFDLYVIDKENEGKSKALNCAIKISSYDYFISMDADSIVEKHSLQSMVNKINHRTLAIGGCVMPIYNKKNILISYQLYEYLRSFYYSRISYECIHCVPLLSGAFSLYKKQAVMAVGGYRSITKGEDFDLTLQLQEYKKKHGGTIDYDKGALIYTQVPFDLLSLIKQRVRWYVGMLQVFKIHKHLFFCVDKLSLVLWTMLIYEQVSLLFDLSLIVFNRQQLLHAILLPILFTSILTIYICVKNDVKNKFDLLLMIMFGYVFHFINNGIKVYSFFVRKDIHWNHVKRRNN